jgi:hypothetical protein
MLLQHNVENRIQSGNLGERYLSVSLETIAELGTQR